jgi:hypothetical protein
MPARIQFIKSPRENTVKLLTRRMHPDAQKNILGKKWGAVGLVQDHLPNLFAMADIASKQANVVVEEVRGTCPQHITMMAIFGDTASVRAALDSIEAIAK